ncbi:LysR family transcriptional regulator [Bordetella genomosp. 13]|uniref:LysR family transcriptional regulator n=1 Tax=Bordetella genomosp. 13 TaxID=463040 RepID=A0A1W6Z948_9BORD|nr:LysR family transcriptional regulator [Bordetella genomosp. 13]ARP93861.1 LysR family transcriptional regulator [Bordetella genomosp. 13]
MNNPIPLMPGGADRLLLMETFVRIVEAGSLSAAAQQMGGTQPTISRRLQALERALGVRLLQRSTHAMKLTEDGVRCYERAKELIMQWQAFESDMRGAGDEPTGTLRVVAPHAFGQQQFIEPLVNYLKKYPRMTVEWLLFDRPPDFIASGIDCAIDVGPLLDPSMIAVRLGDVPRIAVAAPSVLDGGRVPQEPEELARLPWIALRMFYRTEVALTHVVTGEARTIGIRPRLSTDSLHAVRAAALQGLGAGIGSEWLLAEDLAAGNLVHLAPQWEAEALPVHLIYPPARFYPARLRRFIETMRAFLPQALRRTTGLPAPADRRDA